MDCLQFCSICDELKDKTQFSAKVFQAGKRLSLDSGYAEGEEQEELEADEEDNEKQVICNSNFFK